MKLEWASVADAVALAGVHAHGFDHPWSARDIEELFAGPGVYGFLAADDAPLGMILCRVVADDCEILTIAVTPDARRRGVGKALVRAAMGAAAQAGADAAFLEVAVDNAPAAALYAGLGFRRIGLRKGYYDRPEGEVDALVMRLDLNAAPA